MFMNSGQTITSLNQQSELCTQNNEGKLYLLACAVGCGEEGGGGGKSEHVGWRRGEGRGGRGVIYPYYLVYLSPPTHLINMH